MVDLIIDPGHGGTDPGANGFGVLEKDWNLKISLYQYNRLKELGASVEITRTTDKTIESTARGNLIKSKHKYCMSNHFNAFNGSARGVETIHSIHSDGKVAKQLADVVVQSSGLPLRRVFDRTYNGGDYYFMHRLTGTTSTIIVEYGFIDNKADHDFYKNEDNFYKVAEAVVKEWCSILGVKYVAPGESEQSKPIAPSKPSTSKPAPSKDTVVWVGTSNKGKRVESIYKGSDKLNFYDGPRWDNPSGTFGYGEGWIVDNLYRVNGSLMYRVQNSKGDLYYITASDKYVRVVGNSAPATKNVTSYKGDSIIDYLNLEGNKHLGGSSFTNRKKLAAKHVIKNYRGTAAQNTQLLNKLRG